MATNEGLKSNSGHQKKGGQETLGIDYESKLDPTGYFWMHGYKVVRGNQFNIHQEERWAHGKTNQIRHHGRKQQEQYMDSRSIGIRGSQED